MTLKEMPKVGDKMRCLRDCSFLTLGREYEITGFRGERFEFVDDEGEKLDDDFDSAWELVVGTPQPDVTGLIANLGRRVHELEGADAVNPDHYMRGKYETIEIIEHIASGYDDGFVAHCAGTAIKYIARAPFKHATPTEDLRKAARYLEFAIKRLEAEASE